MAAPARRAPVAGGARTGRGGGARLRLSLAVGGDPVAGGGGGDRRDAGRLRDGGRAAAGFLTELQRFDPGTVAEAAARDDLAGAPLSGRDAATRAAIAAT